MRDSAPKNQHDKKKLPEQIIVPASKPERSTDHKLAKANGTNRTYLNDEHPPSIMLVAAIATSGSLCTTNRPWDSQGISTAWSAPWSLILRGNRTSQSKPGQEMHRRIRFPPGFPAISRIGNACAGFEQVGAPNYRLLQT
jgi:hypothetical protein